MKIFYSSLLLILLFSCKQYYIEKNCFEDGKEKNNKYKEFKIDSQEEILRANPSHLRFIINKELKTYDEESKDDRVFRSESESRKRIEKYNKKFTDLRKNFGEQFFYKNIQKENNNIYGIGENQFGYWFLEVKNNTPNAYYLGLSNFTYFNNVQPENFVSGNRLLAYGSFIRISESWGYPFGPKKEAVKDQLVFEINLDLVRKDSDKDRFNDLFEKLILLNPNSADTDNDGISDFIDINPLYKSEKSKFTDLYSQVVDHDYQNFDFSKNNYSFAGYFSDCDYFQKINPTLVKVLIYPEKERFNLKSDYRLGMFPDYIGKIKKDRDDKKFFINYGSGAGGGFIEAIYENGKWILSKQSTYAI
ncbi:hypothetical protein VUJ46_05750 [Chryseobacterium sp. MYb264]|uniref:hypothetical protein n=1 Tax=Chryseobacterium sp. MYb264 TaxID=2745153 RepID=UPI002E13300C|nr:hypothetical protein VUJ46_05750 [Chryseobacterium sp. MYb264]